MSREEPDPYAVLGLPHSATASEIKRRYRELARRYHPDMNPGEEATHKITVINAAYAILGDAEQRASYDAERVLREKSPVIPDPSTGGKREPRPFRRAASERVEFNGFGRASAGPAPNAGPTRRPSTRAASGSETRANPDTSGRVLTMGQLLSEARLAVINRHYAEAESFCLQALSLDNRNSVAYEILGEIYAKQGRPDRANSAYAYAIQFDPRNWNAHVKLEVLNGQPPAGHRGPTMTRPAPGSGWRRLLDGQYRDTVLGALSVVLAAAFFATLALFAGHPGPPLQAGIPSVFALSPNLLVALTCDGMIAGMLLALYGGMRPISEELALRASAYPQRRGRIPPGLVLMAFAVVWFYLSLILYLAIGVSRRGSSRSVWRVYGVVLVLTFVFTLLYSVAVNAAGTVMVAAFAGNALFPATMAGWFLSDAIRLRGR